MYKLNRRKYKHFDNKEPFEGIISMKTKKNKFQHSNCHTNPPSGTVSFKTKLTVFEWRVPGATLPKPHMTFYTNWAGAGWVTYRVPDMYTCFLYGLILTFFIFFLTDAMFWNGCLKFWKWNFLMFYIKVHWTKNSLLPYLLLTMGDGQMPTWSSIVQILNYETRQKAYSAFQIPWKYVLAWI